MGAEPPRRRGRVVHGAANQRVAEAKATSVAGGMHQVHAHELIELGQGVRQLLVCRGGGQLGIERVTADRGPLHQRPRAGQEGIHLEPNPRHQRRGQAARGLARGPSQLSQEQRVTGRLGGHTLAQPGIVHVLQQLERRLALERQKRQMGHRGGVSSGVEQPRRGVDRPQREDQQMGAARRPAQEVQNQLDRCVVGPMQVVEHQHHGLLASKQLQQAAQGAVIAEALGGAGLAARRRGRVGGCGGQHGTEIAPERRHPPRMHGGNVVVEGIDHHAERHVALMLGGAGREHEHALVARLVANGGEQHALPDPGLSEDPQSAARALLDLRHGSRGVSELLLASDQLHACSLGTSSGPCVTDPGVDHGVSRVGRTPLLIERLSRSQADGDPTVTSAPQARVAPSPPTVPTPPPTPRAPRQLNPYSAADHLTRLYRLAVGLCGSRTLAEDLVQETYARVLARPRLVRGDEFSYLARALRNVLINHVRAETRRGEVPAPEHFDTPDTRPTTDPQAAVLTRELYRTIAELPEDQRHVVAAVDLAGMTYADAALLLGVPAGTVMSRLYRARERIAAALEL